MSEHEFDRIKAIIIPYFIKVFGEKHSNIIIDNINKAELIDCWTLDGRKAQMLRAFSKKRVELTLEFLNRNNINIPDELKAELKEEHGTYKLQNIKEASSILKDRKSVV